MQTELTLSELAEKSAIRYDTLYRMARRKFPEISWSKDTEVSEQMAQVLSGKKRKARRTTTNPNPKPEARKPKRTAEEMRTAAFDAVTISVVVAHAGLIWYDCAALWATPGTIGGGIAFLVVLAALLISSDPTKPRTSEAALWLIFIIDVAAWWVHYPTFLLETKASPIITGCLAAFLCAMSFGALFLYRDSKID